MCYWKYLKYLFRHKWFVMAECFKRGLFAQGILHDLSKFFPSEFIPYAQFFYGKGQPEQKGDRVGEGKDPEKEKAMKRAWLLHVHRNKHHWNWWVVVDGKDKVQALDMPERYIVEMVCDWEGAAKAIRGKTASAKEWYKRVKSLLLLSEKTRKRVEELLNT